MTISEGTLSKPFLLVNPKASSGLAAAQGGFAEAHRLDTLCSLLLALCHESQVHQGLRDVPPLVHCEQE
jgi:hypothetical protein